jgi:hypothetical protein
MVLTVLTAALLMATPVIAQDKAKKADKGDKPHTAAEVQKDIQDHLAMADAHVAAAKCLQSGKGEKDCHAQLVKDCKGLGIGKLCGMKHKH